MLLLLEGHTGSPMTLQFDPLQPEERLWSAAYDKTIRLWDISKRAGDSYDAPLSDSTDSTAASAPRWSCAGRCLRVFSGHTGVVFGLAVLPHLLVSSSRDGSVRLWDKDNGALLRELESGRSSSALTDDISSASLSSEALRGSLASSRTQSREIKCIAVTARGDLLAASSDGKIQLFSFEKRNGDALPPPPSMARRGGGGVTGSFPRASSYGAAGDRDGGAGDHSPPQQDGCSIM